MIDDYLVMSGEASLERKGKYRDITQAKLVQDFHHTHLITLTPVTGHAAFSLWPHHQPRLEMPATEDAMSESRRHAKPNH